MDAYDGAIAYMDEHIGQLLDEMQERGLGDNTLIVITSDHGEAFGEHGTFRHARSLYREEIYVPLIFRMPGQIPSGLHVSQPVTNAALPATVMDIIGNDEGKSFPGVPLTHLWQASEPGSNWAMPLAEMKHRPWLPESAPLSRGTMRSLISPEWHYIENDGLGSELYDWANDPEESNNLSETSEGQVIVDEFRDSLQTILNRDTTTTVN